MVVVSALAFRRCPVFDRYPWTPSDHRGRVLHLVARRSDGVHM